MTMNIGLTSSDLAIAFPPSVLSHLTLSVASVVFTCVGVQGNTNEKLAVMERVDNEYWTYLQSLPQSFASLCVEAVVTQIQRRDTRIHLTQNTAKKGKSSWLS